MEEPWLRRESQVYRLDAATRNGGKVTFMDGLKIFF